MRAPSGLLILVLAIALMPALLVRADGHPDAAMRALRKDPSLKVRTQAALILGQRGARHAVPALCAALEGDDAPAVRIAAAAALAKVGDGSARPSLEAARRGDPDPEVRQAAARALAELGTGRLQAVAVEEPNGTATEIERSALREALARHLASRGFAVVRSPTQARIRLKPAVLAVDVDDAGGHVSIAVKASVMAIDGSGRMAAMLESGARLRASGPRPPDPAVEKLAVLALDAAAKTLSEDLAEKLR